MGTGPFSVSVGDFNGDGKDDLATANRDANSVSVLLNNGDGTFGPNTDYPVASITFSVSVGDFNGDGQHDLAAANYYDNSVSVLLNGWDGTFGLKTDYTVNSYPYSVSVGDFNGDGKDDLATGNMVAPGVSMLLNNGDGTFGPKTDYLAAYSRHWVSVGDFNGDGQADLAAANYNHASVSVLLNTSGPVVPLPDLDGTLNGLIDYILTTFNGVPPDGELVFHSGDPIPGTEETVPYSVQIGKIPAALGGGSDLQLDNITLTFPANLDFDSSTNTWSGGVGITANQGVLLPGLLDVGVVNDAFDNPRRVKSATVKGQQANGKYEVVFTLAGDHRDLGDNVLFPSNEIAVLNSNPATFNANAILFTNVSFDEDRGETHVTVEYTSDPGSSWTGGTLLAACDRDANGDGDAVGVSGIIQLAPGDPNSILNFDVLEAADIGLPRWLDVGITELQMEFTDFRTDDSNNGLRLNGSLRGLKTGNFLVDQALRYNPLLKLDVTGTLTGIQIDIDKLAEGRVTSGVVTLPKTPIPDLSGISGEISGSIFGVGSIQAGFIVKQVSVDANGEITTQESAIEETALYARHAAVLFHLPGRRSRSMMVRAERRPKRKGPLAHGFNFAISELGFLQYFVFSNVNIPLEPISGLAITELRGGVRLNSNIEDLQVRLPFGTTAGTVTPFVDPENGADTDYRITLTTTGHNLKVGDEFRIIDAGNSKYNSGVDSFVVHERQRQ